jgi:hypothetical protein
MIKKQEQNEDRRGIASPEVREQLVMLGRMLQIRSVYE